MKIISYSLVILLLLSGCDNESEKLDNSLSVLIEEHDLTGDPSTGRDIPSINDSKAQLGMKLFFTKTMSIPGDTACVTCHHPLLGGGDGLQIAVGTGAEDTDIFGYNRLIAPGSVIYDDANGGPTQSVNSPTTYNVALQDRFLAWHGAIEAVAPDAGYNGSVGGLYDLDSLYEADGTTRIINQNAGDNLPASQAHFPVQNPIEMAGKGAEIAGLDSYGIRQVLFERFTGEGDSNNTGTNYLSQKQRDTWQAAFDDAGVDLTDANIYNMISYYERTQLFIENPWKKYIDGDKSALSDDAKEGAILFFSSYEEGGANCTQCHAGDFFTDNAVHVMAVPQIGLGTQVDGDTYGREDITNTGSDRYKWRTMSLLNIEKTGPWGHDGAFTSLRAMVQHMVDPSTDYDQSNVLQTGMQNTEYTNENHARALEQLAKNRVDGISPHSVADLDDTQIDQIVEFLYALTDSRLNDYEYMKQWVPENDENARILDLQVNVTLPEEATKEN